MAGVKSVLSPRSSNSGHSLLPPIIANERDRHFLINLNQYIDEELGKVKDRFDPEQRYAVYKSSFNQIIDYVTAYKPLLTAIKAEYEDCIDTIQRGQKEAFFLSGKLKAMASEPSTIRNYRKRSDELEQRLAVIRDNNAQLQAEVAQLRQERAEKERRAQAIAEPPVREIKRDRRHIPGLTVEQSTDLKILTSELSKLERQLRDLNISYRTRFQKKDTQRELKEHLATKVAHRDQLIDYTEAQKLRRLKLKTATEAAQAYLKIQPPHQTIGDAVITALTRQSNSLHADKGEDGGARGTPSTTFEEDDPTREKEAEMMLEYIEKFNELMEDFKYEEAAVHAANSPKGILRTPETLNRFKDVQDQHRGGAEASPLLAFCDALMATVPAYGAQPGEQLCVESVTVALQENRMDLLMHWIAQDRLTVSEGLGNILYEHAHAKPRTAKKCLALAQKLYMDSEAHIPAMMCMVKQGRVTQAVEYGQKARCHPRDYMALLERLPHSVELARGLHEQRLHNGRSLLPLGVIATTLLGAAAPHTAIQLLLHVQAQSSTEGGQETPLRRAVFEDSVSLEEDWARLVQRVQDAGHAELAIDLLAAITVKDVIKNAAQRAQEMIQADVDSGIEPPKYDALRIETETTKFETPRAKARVVGFDDGVNDSSTARSTTTQDVMSSNRSGNTLDPVSSHSVVTGDESELRSLEETGTDTATEL